jgi:2-polyprenyl-3-methyl-5-hydroxy-6-metoxy-1,4-benzoquinol methylase
MASIKDNRGFNQGFALVKSTEVRMRRRADAFVREMNMKQTREILEIGCGTGEIAYWVAERTGAHVLGIDLCAPFIEKARKRSPLPNLQYQVMDFNQPDCLFDQKFDYIIGNGILHHLYYTLPVALVNIRRLLKPDGTLLFFEPNIYNPYCTLIFTVPFLRVKARLEPTEMAFSKRFIVHRLYEANFTEIHVTYKDFLLPGVPDILINPLILSGDILEHIPVLNKMAQSIFIKAKKSHE